ESSSSAWLMVRSKVSANMELQAVGHRRQMRGFPIRLRQVTWKVSTSILVILPSKRVDRQWSALVPPPRYLSRYPVLTYLSAQQQEVNLQATTNLKPRPNQSWLETSCCHVDPNTKPGPTHQSSPELFVAP